MRNVCYKVSTVVMLLDFAGSGKPREAYFSFLELCSFLTLVIFVGGRKLTHILANLR